MQEARVKTSLPYRVRGPKPYGDVEMEHYAQRYAWWLREIKRSYGYTEVKVEEQVSIMPNIGKDIFGTCDCILMKQQRPTYLMELSMGKVLRVEAKENPQLKLYALKHLRYQFTHDIHTIRMSIYQPRINNISTAETP